MSLDQLGQQLKRITDSVTGKCSVTISTPEGDFDINGSAKLSAASLIKIPILLEAFRQVEVGILDLNQPIDIPPEEKVGGMGVLTRLSDGMTLPFRDVITLMIIVSDNTATNLVIDQVGLERVNALCSELNAEQTVLGRRLMDLKAREEGRDNFTSANDTVIFLREVTEGSLVGSEGRQEMIEILKQQQFNTKLPARIPKGVPGDPVLAHKTGELPGVEHDAGIFMNQGTNVYVAGLFTELSDNLDGQEALAAIGEAVYNYLHE